jgi:hypothetical protein
MRWSALGAVALALAASAVFAAAASASTSRTYDRDPVVELIIKDCSRDGHLDHDYPLRSLREALDDLSWKERRHTRCERVLERAIDRAKRKLDHEVFRIWADCGRDEDLDRKYSIEALRRALRRLPDDLRDYTDCERVIERALERAKRKLRDEVDKILRDCDRDGDLDRRYSDEALLLALRKADRRCAKAIEREFKDHGRKGGKGRHDDDDKKGRHDDD